MEASHTLTLDIAGPFAGALGNHADNLVLRAARALAGRAATALGAAITLTKNLPVASGIGGGSADAAATLRALCRLWRLDMDADALAALGLSIGADVPVCLHGRTARVRGIGERISPVADLPETALLLVNPGVAVATGAVFAGRTGPYSAVMEMPPDFADARALARGLAPFRNDLAPSACRLVPQIDEVLASLAAEPDCLIARLSGSGATCFGLFGSSQAANEAALRIRKSHAAWWVKSGHLLAETPAPEPGG